MKKLNKLNIVVCSCCSKRLLRSKRFTASQFPYVIPCLNFMTVQTSKGKVIHDYKVLIRKTTSFEYEKLLL